LKQGVAGIGVSLLPSYAASPVSGSEKTNLLFVIADQYRFDAMSCAGASPLETPNLDRSPARGLGSPKPTPTALSVVRRGRPC
jgi:hypothetical protein